MSFIKKLLGKKEVEYGLSEAVEKFENVTEEERKNKKKEIKELRDSCFSEIQKFKEEINCLKDSETPDKLGKTAENAKDDYCRKIDNLLDDFEENFDPEEDVLSFYQKLKRCYPSGRASKYITHFFEEEMKEARVHLKRAIAKLEEINDKLEIKRDFETLKDYKKDIEEDLDEIKYLEEEKQKLIHKIEEKRDLIDNLREEIDNIAPSDKFKKLETQLRSLEDNKDELENKIKSKVGFLPRIFRKYGYVTNKEIETPYEELINSPNSFKNILDKVKDLYQNDEIEINNEKIKRINKLRNNFKELKNKVIKLKDINRELEENKRKIKELKEQREDKKRRKKRDKEDHKNKLNNLKKEKQKIEDKLERKKKNVKNTRKNIENLVSNKLKGKIKIKKILEE
ncbi:hypothetical protein C9439_06100 [archaeon SCG-AAA382B04]|nr:hypothetical protein C9439_06100 [archaeon SCG-AAA382B04]